MAAPYATLADLAAVLPAAALATISTAIQQRALDARSDYADDKMRARYRLPLGTPYPVSLTQAIAHLAAFDVMVSRGFDPTRGADVVIQDRANLALKYLDDVERQRAHPAVVEAGAGADPAYPAPMVISAPRAGWMPGTADVPNPYGGYFWRKPGF